MSGLGWRVDKAAKALAIPTPEDVAQARQVAEGVRTWHKWALAGMTCAPCAAGLDAMARGFSDDAAILESLRREDLTERLVYEFDRAMLHRCCLQSLLRASEAGGPPATRHVCEPSSFDRRLSTGRTSKRWGGRPTR